MGAGLTIRCEHTFVQKPKKMLFSESLRCYELWFTLSAVEFTLMKNFKFTLLLPLTYKHDPSDRIDDAGACFILIGVIYTPSIYRIFINILMSSKRH